MADDEYESVICVKNEVQIYRIPPRSSNRGYRAADWKLDQPDWNGRLRICAKGKNCYIKIEDKSTGELFAKCPVDSYPGIAVEGVLDSSRYFVLRIENEDGRHAFIGMGFQDRGDSFDFNVSLQDHFKWVKQSEQIAAEAAQPDNTPKLDLKFKEGQTIHINISKKPGSSGTARPKPSGGGVGFIAPPPGSGFAPKLAPPPGSGGLSPNAGRRVIASQQFQQKSTQPQPSADLFGGMSAFAPSQPIQQPFAPASDQWGDFTSASGNSDGGDSWVQF